MKEPKRLEIIVGDPSKPELHTVTTVDCLLEVAELLTNPPRYRLNPPPLPVGRIEKELPAVLRIRSEYELKRDILRGEFEDKIRKSRIAENEEIENAKV